MLIDDFFTLSYFIRLEVQANLPIIKDESVDRATQTDTHIWQREDLELLRKAYNNKIASIEQKYSVCGSPYDKAMMDLKSELEEMRENWRSTQEQLEICRIELGDQQRENMRKQIAINGLKQFAMAQLISADEARWAAKLERQSAHNTFIDHLKAQEERRNQCDSLRNEQQTRDASVKLPSPLDLAIIYRKAEETRAENSRLQNELCDAVAALSHYEKAYKFLLKHIDEGKQTSG